MAPSRIPKRRPSGGAVRAAAGSDRAERPRPGAVAALGAAIALITFVAFSGVFSSEFVNFDDDVYVTSNAHVQGGVNGRSVGWAFRSFEGANWFPVTWMSHMVDVQLFGLRAGAHHGTSVLLHTLNAVLLLLLLVRMTVCLWRSAFVACLFAIHPLHVESVAWVAERKDVLSTFFGLLALLAWLGFLRHRKARWYLSAAALYALSLMSKPMLVTLPLVLLLLDAWPLRRVDLSRRGIPRTVGKLLIEKTPLFLLAAASCCVTVWAQHAGGAVQSLEKFSFPQRLANAAMAYAFYLWKMVAPVSLAAFYPHPHLGLTSWQAVGSFLALAGLSAAALVAARRAPYVAVGWLWFLGTLVPVIGLVQVGAQACADRYTYVPLVGIFIAIAWGLAEIGRRGRLAQYAVCATAALSLVALFALTRVQVGHWQSTRLLFEHALAVTSENYMAHNNLGRTLADQGRLEEAMAHYRDAIRIEPSFSDAHNNLGVALALSGKGNEAVECYREAIRLNPGNAQAYCNLGIDLAHAGHLEEAIGAYRCALALAPDSPDAHNNMGVALTKQGRIPEAIAQFRETLLLKPDDGVTLSNLGRVLLASNRPSEAAGCFERALRTDPHSAELHNDLGTALLRADRPSEASDHFREALQIRPDFGEAASNLERAEGLIRWAPKPPGEPRP